MPESKVHQSPKYGNKAGLQIFYFVLRLFGPRPAYFILIFVIAYYVFVLRRPRKLASYYLKQRFPQDSAVTRFFRTYLYIYNFGKVLIDQAAIGILSRKAFKIEFPRWQELYELSQRKRGMVLVTSHFGNWQTAMAAVEDLAVPVNFLIRLEEHMEGRHFFDLAGIRSKIKVIDPAGFMGGLVDAINVLEKGECVAIMGDRAWGSRTKAYPFLGKEAAFPVTPYHLVSASGADLIMLLTVRTGKLAFKIDFFYLTGEDEHLRNLSTQKVVDKLLPRYVEKLEAYTKKYPYMWFNIFDFWNVNKQEFETEKI